MIGLDSVDVSTLNSNGAVDMSLEDCERSICCRGEQGDLIAWRVIFDMTA